MSEPLNLAEIMRRCNAIIHYKLGSENMPALETVELARIVLRLVAAQRDLRDSYLGNGEGRAWCTKVHGIVDSEGEG